jgi:trans-aconitate methyltransferase
MPAEKILPPEPSHEERTYLAVHHRRLEYVVALVMRLTAATPRPRLLDVGPHLLTELLRDRTGALVDQLGFRNDRLSRPRPGEAHYDLDLNSTLDRRRWPSMPPYDAVLACEVIEHLHVPPSVVLAFLRSLLMPGGHLVVQTPNAVALKRRAVMLLGRNPYERIRESTDNPGHFREYTREELVEYAAGAGLDLVSFASEDYFDHAALPGLANRVYGAVTSLLPESLRDGMTFVFRRSG